MQSKYQKTRTSLLSCERRRKYAELPSVMAGGQITSDVRSTNEQILHSTPSFSLPAHASPSYITGSPSHNPRVLCLIL